MIHFNKITSSLFASVLLLCFSYMVHGADKPIWQGKVGDLTVRWTEADITANKGGKMVFSAQALAEQTFKTDFLADKSLLDDNNECEYIRTFTLLSLVGSIASLKETEYVSCQSMPHPSIETRFVGRDLAQADQVMELTKFFAESEILKGMLADPLIKKILAQTDSKTPTTLTELYEALEWADIIVKDCGYYLPADFLSQFAAHHVFRNKLAVRLNLLPISHACHSTNLVQLGFYIPIPAKFKNAFQQAQKRKVGFLMGHSKKFAGNNSTEIAFFTAKTVTVQTGDTLFGIAKHYHRSVAELAAWNDLQAPYPLSVGQTLSIQSPITIESPTPVATTEPATKKPVEEKIEYYTVVAGDTLSGIAKNYGLPMTELAAWNNLRAPSYIIRIKQRLRVSNPKLTFSKNEAKTLNTGAIKTEVRKKPSVKYRIITVSGTNVRSAPKLAAERVAQLSLGTIVKELARSETQEKIGSSQDYWYQIEMEKGKTGWAFGNLSKPFEPTQRAKLYQEIAQSRLQRKLNWADQTDLTHFLARAKDEVSSSPEIAAELALSHLVSLQKAIDHINPENQDKSPYNTWAKQQQSQNLIHYDEVQGAWHINPVVFWNLHDQYYPLPISERIGWAAAKNPLGGECEGFFECNLRRINKTMVNYLKYHPKGQSGEKALDEIAEFISWHEQEKKLDISQEDVDLFRLLAILHTSVERTNHPKTNGILRKIDKLKQLVEQSLSP